MTDAATQLPASGSNEKQRGRPLGWGTRRLADVSDIISGVALGRKLASNRTRRVPYLRVANVKDGHLDLSYVYELEATDAEIEKLRLQYGDLLLTEGGDRDKLGRGTFWRGEIPDCIHQNHIFRVRFDLTRFCPTFVAAQIGSPYGKSYFLRHAKQTTGIATINRTVLANFPLLVPPPSEQRRISAHLAEQMAAVTQARAAAEASLEAGIVLRRTLLRQAFQGITPLSVGGQQGTPPCGWRWVHLSRLARLESGHTPSRRHPEWWGGTIPWIALPDIRALDGKIAYETAEYTNEDGIAHSAARVLPAGTVVLSRTASVGFVTIMGRPMATSQDFVNWVCGPELEPRFLALLFRAAREYIRFLSSGAIHKTVYVPTVKAFCVCVPPVVEQRKVAAKVEKQLSEIERLVAAIREQLSALTALPSSILEGIFGGGQ